MAKIGRTKLEDRKKKQIIADYIESQNYSAVARKHNVSRTTVKALVEGEKDVTEKIKQRKEQNTQDILAYMESKKDIVCDLIELYLTELSNRDKIAATSIQQLATAMGIVIDKFTKMPYRADEESIGGVLILPEVKEAKKTGDE